MCMRICIFLHVCVCNMCATADHKGQKKALDFLELELKMVVIHPVDTGN